MKESLNTGKVAFFRHDKLVVGDQVFIYDMKDIGQSPKYFEQNTLRICSYNVRGLKNLKFDIEFKNYLELYDIVALYETWQISEHEFEGFLEGFTAYESFREQSKGCKRGSGGVLVLIRESIVKTNFIKRTFHT